jgi:hypothetical protein
MASKIHIYVVTLSPTNVSPLVQRLVRASSKQRALRHVVKDVIAVDLASQELLVQLGAAGTKVENAS